MVNITYKLNCNLFISLNISTCNIKPKKKQKRRTTLIIKNNSNTRKLQISVEKSNKIIKERKQRNLNRSPQTSRYRSSGQAETYSQREVPFKRKKENEKKN